MTMEIWDDKSRDELRERLSSAILGELRLARFDPQGVLEHSRDVWMQDVCPLDEWDEFLQFTKEQVDRLAAEVSAEMFSWPEETDCDRLDRVERVLRERDILLWQASPCCNSCTGAELPDRIDLIDQRCPGFRDRVRGYSFFIDQNLPEHLAESRNLSDYLTYGWFAPDDTQPDPEVYQREALIIAHEVAECLRSEGFEVD